MTLGELIRTNPPMIRYQHHALVVDIDGREYSVHSAVLQDDAQRIVLFLGKAIGET